MEKLSDMMQARLDKWRKNITPVASTKKLQQNFVCRREYGDDISEYDPQNILKEEINGKSTRQ